MHVKSHVNARAHTQENIQEDSLKTYSFYPVAKNTETKSTKLTKLVTMCLTSKIDKTLIILQY